MDYERPPFLGHVPHYYGDLVRQLFFGTAALMLITAPLYADNMGVQLPFLVGGALVLVAIAAMASPHNKTIFLAGAVASGVGTVIYEMWTLAAYGGGAWVPVILTQLIAVLFLIAFYFNLKTVRAFVMNSVGRLHGEGEFEIPEPDAGLDERHAPDRTKHMSERMN